MNSCLVIVDYQNDFVNGSLGFNEAKKLERNIVNKMNEYRENGADIIFTLDTHYSDYLTTQEGRMLPIEHCISGTDGHRLYGEVGRTKTVSDKTFEKNTFGCEKLYEHFKRNKYQSIDLVGVVTNICVIANAILAKTALPKAHIAVDAACTASNNRELHNAALRVMESLQIKILNREEKQNG